MFGDTYWYISVRIIGDHRIDFVGFYQCSKLYPVMDYTRAACILAYPEFCLPGASIYIDSVVSIGKEEYDRNRKKSDSYVSAEDSKPRRDFTIIPGGLK